MISLFLIIGINEDSPAFAGNPYSFSVAEDAAVDSTVGSMTATDADDGTDGMDDTHLILLETVDENYEFFGGLVATFRVCSHTAIAKAKLQI